MDIIEKWLCDQAENFNGEARQAVRLVATRWHDVGQDVLAEQLRTMGEPDASPLNERP